ncbi:MAG: tetratricopeptide repeat protein [Gammaproteobacteria bacterium]|jgi:hypothetical protein
MPFAFNRFHSFFLFVLLIVVLLPGRAFAATADQYFESGKAAFQRGEYRQAAQAFEQARQAGMDTAAVHYNLGVTYYRLEDYLRSEAEFQKVARYPKMTAIAHYNLGLVKLRQGDTEVARGYFRRVYAETDDAKLKELAARMLDRVDTTTRRAAGKRWIGAVFAGIGHDDNVTLENTNLGTGTGVSGKSDNFLELFGTVNGVLHGKREDGLLLKASAFRDDYFDLNSYDFTLVNLGLFKTLPMGSWNGEFGGYTTFSHLGSKNYLRTLDLSAQGTHYFSSRSRLRLRYRYHDISSLDSVYDYLAGYAHDFMAEGRWFFDSVQLRAYYRLDIENRNDYRTSTVFYSYSPTRNTVHADVTWLLPDRWSLNAGADYRNSRYADSNILSTGEVVRRDDDRVRATLRLTRQLTRRADAFLRYEYKDNHSNIAVYSYTSNVVMGGAEYLF